MMGTGFVHGQSNGFQHGNVGGYADNTNGGNVEDNTKGRYIDDNGDEPKRNNWFAGGHNNDQLNGHNSDGHVGGTGKDVVSTVYNNENTDGYKGDGYPSDSNEFPAAGYTNGVTTVENELFKERGPISHRNDDSIDSKDSDVDLLPTRHLTRYGLRPHSTTGQSRLSNERFITSSIAETRTGKKGRFEKPNFLTKNDYLRGRPLLRPNSPTQKDKGTGQSWNLNADLGPSRNTGKETEEKPGDAFNPNENFPGAARHNTMDRNDGLGDFPIDHTPHSLTGQANTIKPKPQSAESQNHDKNLQNVGGLQENEEEFKTGTLHVIAPELESSARRIGPQPVQPSQGFQQRAQPPFQNDHLYNRLPHELQPNAPVDRIQSTPNQQFPEHIVQPVKQNRFPGNRERGNAEHFPGSTEHGNMEYFPNRRDHGDMELFPNSRNHGYMEHFPDSTEHGSMEHFPDRREHGNLEGFTDGKEHGNLEVFPDRGHASVDMKSNADRRSGYLLQKDHDQHGNQDLRSVSDPSFDSSSYRNLGQQLALPSSQRFDNSDKTRNINVFDRNQYDFKNKPVSLRSGSRKLVSGAPRSDIDGFGAGDYNKQAPTTVNRVHPDNFQNLQKTHTSSEFDGEIVSPEHKGLYDFPERGLVESPAHNGALMLPGNNWPPVFREQNGPRIPQEYNHPSSLPGHNVLPDVPEQNGLTEEISPPFFPKLDIPSKQDADPLSGLFDMDGGDSKHQESADLPDPEDIKDGVVTATKLQGEIKAPPINHGKVRPTTHSDFDCSKRSDGVIESGCRAFYRCVSGKTFFVECDYNYVLNTDIGDCDRRENAPAPCGVKQDCMEKENGKYADAERDCTYYYTCHEGHFMGTNKCNPGLVFNEDRQICDWPDSAAESCKEASKSYVERYGR
ncbi:uncharacterized protein LOC106175515 [Lingula anatina]|uniref:Uncharacterized protein LOC106175515 n=1 Tax=Lingula anatina TaxID=7574 RepID=A0A1S3JSJ6_LINAN|nr:uncharacterized protein LOC106175515 [Lingula anatina]|eukprot:XP_013413014.1 uncharacterized protein LOC106175515 [Lingula anatina]